MNADFFFVIQWWLYFFILGLIFLPFTTSIFSKFIDLGYIFSKILGIVIISYLIFLGGLLHILPFNLWSVYSVIFIAIIANVFLIRKRGVGNIKKKMLYLFVFEEILFFISLSVWSLVKGYQPDIYGLEKYMDFGFINSILRSTYFPPQDMWFTPEPINYYYFGHLTTAVLTKLSQLPSYISYNLMLSTIFAFTIVSSFSIVATLTFEVIKKRKTSIVTGILAGIITSLGGNLHTLYSLFKPYSPPESPLPFWKLGFNPFNFPNEYWYPNATRFIPFTIHEFPSYSFVVSDLHGHVLDIPFVFLSLALILTFFLKQRVDAKLIILASFLLSIMYMTNAWDGIIYFGLLTFAILVLNLPILKISHSKHNKIYFRIIKSSIKEIKNKNSYLLHSFKYILLTGIGYFVFSFPFNINFKPFVSGFGVICAPEFLTKLGNIGPVLFEANHCQRSPLWMIVVLYGFFLIFSVALCIKIFSLKKIQSSLIYLLLLIIISFLLIITPEFVYAKDIYPAHYRANTMFKLGYQAFIMLSLVSAFSITYLLHTAKKIVWLPISTVLICLILIYPYFAVSSYFDNFKNYKGINGITYLKKVHPNDFDAIMWINSNISEQPVILESQGDSYSDYGRISANTGLPTVLGWTVHEWLWRGDYKYPQSRLDDVRALYEDDIDKTKQLIQKYNISYIYIGDLERSKYPLLNEKKFLVLGTLVYQNGTTKIYKML